MRFVVQEVKCISDWFFSNKNSHDNKNGAYQTLLVIFIHFKRFLHIFLPHSSKIREALILLTEGGSSWWEICISQPWHLQLSLVI